MTNSTGMVSTLLAGGAALLLASAGYAQAPAAAPAAAPAPAAAATAPAAAAPAAAAAATGASQDAVSDEVANIIKGNLDKGMNWFGGPVYTGEPALAATAALVKAGGGPENFSFAKALVSMLGADVVNAEVANLTKIYGEADVTNFVEGMDFAVAAGLKRATEAGVKLPDPPKDLVGVNLAKALVKAGTVDGTFWSGYLFDVALSHDLHNAVMGDVEAEKDSRTDLNIHKILNRAMYDVAQTLGVEGVKLAPLH